MQDQINRLPKLAKDKHKENKAFFAKLKKRPPKKIDYIMQDLHDAEFERTDCLDCANCCKTTGPLFTDKDISRIAKSFKMKEQQFIETYLRLDEENDYILQSVPCTFLGIDIVLYMMYALRHVESFHIQIERNFNKFLSLH